MLPHRSGQAGQGMSDNCSGNLDMEEQHEISFGGNIS